MLRGLTAALAAAATLWTSGGVAGRDVAVTARVPTIAGPTGLGFGHGLLWVTRDNSTVARVDPRSGRIVGRTHVGRFPVRVAVGARWAWVTNSASDSVTKLDARTGRSLRTIQVGDQPAGVTLAGGAVWVACLGDTRLFRIDPASARVVAAIPIGPPPEDPPALAVDARGLWVTRMDRVVRLNPRSNAIVASVPVRGPTDVATGGGAVWVASLEHRRLTRIDAASAAVDGSFLIGHGLSGVTLALHRVWALDNYASTVSELDAVTGRTLATVRVGPHSYDIASGAGAVWAQSYEEKDVYKIQPIAPLSD